ncbi:hydroxymethylbilane synthase [Georgenia soli]|uniref:Porphobilinogen deaminase n=1 Tax=Georgenia soli TaxID=638953 RepID=A0A2A9ENB9_9MICO|nr:hydroxymethylbilane synthase [Georgenia soli]PFG40031.1 hydroxymethylbilane synthase [Georgenia soli]
MSLTTAPLRIGTRGSDLALTQTRTVADALGAASGREVELVRVRTEGDRSAASLSAIGGTGVFAAALREALLAGECDVAVHSLKDLPTAPTAGLSLGAFPERADHRDVLCARDGWTLATLPAGARIGTGSPRRAAQLRLARPDVEVVDIRGNVGTRLGRVGDDLDAVVLAAAGLTRLGLLEHVTETLETDVMLPAPGQGALAVECRTEDLHGTELGTWMRKIDSVGTRLTVLAERAVLRTLEAGCTAPVAAHAELLPADGDAPARLELRAGVFDPAGTRSLVGTAVEEMDGLPVSMEANGIAIKQDVFLSLAVDLGVSAAEQLLEDGAAEVAGLRTHEVAPAVDAAGEDRPAGPVA